MTSRTIAAAFAIALVSFSLTRNLEARASSPGDFPGTGVWSVSDLDGGDIRFDIRGQSQHESYEQSQSVPLAGLHGLTSAELASSGTPVAFLVERDAGTISCAGRVAARSGAGTFTLSPAPGYAAQLQTRGIEAPTGDEQRRLIVSDVSLAYVDTLRHAGARPRTPEDLIGLANHGVTQEYVTALAGADVRFSTPDDLVLLADHGVRPEFARSLRSTGNAFSPSDLAEMSDHGVTVSLVRGMTALGYRPSARDLVDLADHGVTVDFAKKIRAYGTKADIAQLVRLKDSGL